MTAAKKDATARDAGTEQHAKWLAYYLGEEGLLSRDGAGKKGARRVGSTVTGSELAGIVEAGLPVSAAEHLRERTHMSLKRFGQFIPRSTLESKREVASTGVSWWRRSPKRQCSQDRANGARFGRCGVALAEEQ